MATKSESVVQALDKIHETLESQTSDDNTEVLEAIDRLREAIESQASDNNKGVMEQLDRIYGFLTTPGSAGNIEFKNIANGPVEVVLGFNNNEYIKLEGPDNQPYFSSHGPLTDLQFKELPGSWVATTFPVNPAQFGETVTWPPEQNEPFDKPPLDYTNTTNHGYSKQSYYFNDRKDWFVTVGPSLPKIVRTSNGGAQFWVGSIGVIAQGGGRYAGARGVTTYVGSGYFDKWPQSPPEQIALLRAGFRALIGTYVKVVLKENVEASSNSDSPPPYEESQGKEDWQPAESYDEASSEIANEEKSSGGRRRRS